MNSQGTPLRNPDLFSDRWLLSPNYRDNYANGGKGDMMRIALSENATAEIGEIKG